MRRPVVFNVHFIYEPVTQQHDSIANLLTQWGCMRIKNIVTCFRRITSLHTLNKEHEWWRANKYRESLNASDIPISVEGLSKHISNRHCYGIYTLKKHES